jgi:hypothetical protein
MYLNLPYLSLFNFLNMANKKIIKYMCGSHSVRIGQYCYRRLLLFIYLFIYCGTMV